LPDQVQGIQESHGREKLKKVGKQGASWGFHHVLKASGDTLGSGLGLGCSSDLLKSGPSPMTNAASDPEAEFQNELRVVRTNGR